MNQVKFSKDAAREFEEAAAWYEKEQPGLGSQFIDSVEAAIQLLNEPSPPLTSVIGAAGELGAKKLLLHKFPFSLIVHETKNYRVIVALAHQSRRPGYWQTRLDP